MGTLHVEPTVSFKIKLSKETHVTKCNLLYRETHKRYFLYLVFCARKASVGNAVSQVMKHTHTKENKNLPVEALLSTQCKT
jgi:hypothetical protein